MPSNIGLWTVTSCPWADLADGLPSMPDSTVALFSKPITLQTMRMIIPDPLTDED